jgi:hypothetical protein
VKNTEVEWDVILNIARLEGCLIARTGKTKCYFEYIGVARWNLFQ